MREHAHVGVSAVGSMPAEYAELVRGTISTDIRMHTEWWNSAEYYPRNSFSAEICSVGALIYIYTH